MNNLYCKNSFIVLFLLSFWKIIGSVTSFGITTTTTKTTNIITTAFKKKNNRIVTSSSSSLSFSFSSLSKEENKRRSFLDYNHHHPLFAEKDNGGGSSSSDDGTGGDLSKGMEEAFKQLGDLSSLGDDSFAVPERKLKQDEAFAKAMQELDLKGIQDSAEGKTVPEVTPEVEAALYSDMAAEISNVSEMDLIDDVKSDLGSKETTTLFPSFDPETRESEKFMEKALDEALQEAKAKGAADDKESILDNKEIMKEIEAIFDRANEQLLEGLEEIRAEQIELSRASAQRNSKESEEKIKQDEERLAAAEDNMKKMLAKVNEETRNVEAAIQDLKNAQEEMDGGVDGQLLDLKSGGIIKQATLVGTLLFSFRSAVDGIAFLSGDPSHLIPAIVQGGIAIVCLALLLFRK